ncbi:MAG: bactofilin family protein [Acetivibrionales bacterium]|jgi:cytoskeletal protein CcmA (bactofilin family)|nr:polymer-forming cytoskeletal protein [Clostridiaceae bacterium]
MFKQKNTPLAMDTVLGEFTTFTGNIESEGSVKILGKVEGDIKASGEVYIEPTAAVTGNIYGSNVYISGYIKGNILSKGILHIMTQAKIYGDIEVNSIVTDEGAIFQGNCRMIEVSTEESTDITPRKSKIKSRRNSSDSD